MNMCLYGNANEMCVYVAHEWSLATREDWVLSTLTQAPFLTFHSSERGESVRAETDFKKEFKHQTGTDV